TLRAIVPQADDSLIVEFAIAACNRLHALDTAIIPAHDYDAGFAANTRTIFAADGEPQALFQVWAAQTARSYRSLIDSHPPTVTAGTYTIAEIRPTESLRLLNTNDEQGYAYINLPDADTVVDRFLMGDLNLLVNPPPDR